eukprot:g8318.t1
MTSFLGEYEATQAKAERAQRQASRTQLLLAERLARLDKQLKSAKEAVDAAVIVETGEDECADADAGQGDPRLHGCPGATEKPTHEIKRRQRVVIAMLIRQPPEASLYSFIGHHLALGFECIEFFFDDIDDDGADARIMGELRRRYKKSVRIHHCNRAWFMELKDSSKCWDQYGEYVFQDLIARQVLAVEYGLRLSCTDGVDWLLHIDVDELLHFDGNGSTNVAKWFANVPEQADIVHFVNLEAAPERSELSQRGSGDYFSEISLFKENPSNVSLAVLRQHWPSGKRKHYFTAYANGKSAVRCGTSHGSVVPDGSHSFRHSTPSMTGPEQTSLTCIEADSVQEGTMGVLFVAQGLTFLGLLAGSYSSFKIVKGGVSKNAEAKEKSVTMLKFWVMYSFLILFDMTIDPWVSWLPFYDYAKLLLLLYMLVPQSNGASILYESLAVPFIKNNEEKFATKVWPHVQGKVIRFANKAQVQIVESLVTSVSSTELDALAREAENSLESVSQEKLRRRRQDQAASSSASTSK